VGRAPHLNTVVKQLELLDAALNDSLVSNKQPAGIIVYKRTNICSGHQAFHKGCQSLIRIASYNRSFKAYGCTQLVALLL
jgi:hypothetical protein